MKILRSIVVSVRSCIEGSRVLFCYNSENEPFNKFTLAGNLEQPALDPRNIKYYHEAEASIVDFGSLLVPRRMKEGPFIFSVDRHTLVGYLKEFPEDDDEENEFTLINVVFFLQKDFYVPAVIDGFVTASRTISNSLIFEETRNRYVSKEVRKIFNVREKFCRENSKRETPLTYKDLISEIILKSNLAASIQDIFIDLKTKGVAHSKINSKYLLPISLNNYENIFSEQLQPYHALFLFKNPEEWINNLIESDELILLTEQFTHIRSKEFINQVKTILQTATPMNSFQYLSMVTNISLETVYHIARYLVYWGKAKIIEAIQLDDIYVMSKIRSPLLNAKGVSYASSKMNYQTVEIRPSVLFNKYEEECPWKDIGKLLSYFEEKKSLDNIIENIPEGEYDAFTDSVAWLISFGILNRIKTYILCIVPSFIEEIKSKLQPTIIEQHLIKISKYLTGRVDLKEMGIKANVSREDIEQIMTTYPNQLIYLSYE
ncbi:hypothetical protein ENUP19_0163G0021 [Entamoeba nuttalli]|uniref:Uncharacterized protein n=2 Tax=Entamoeba nuttalli TaxID=412467 RepID=K2GHW0_ENTNP|nr:hypothetical protein ENU1_024700 [Entamoeba nuttalli P19]EKE42331.1 hypothetical protein ENU1_024700 [Entamoeba nuttalli P19]|eukprot:XP_008855338.1 hypothetical protein ENU1_024700 [Entamoeba nuttalli P19]